MLEWWNSASLFVVDSVLGWLLYLPGDAAIIGVALVSAIVLTALRRFTTNQNLLGRIAHDKRRLRELVRSTKDPDARRRFRTTRAEVMLKALRAETRPLLFSLIPIALLATWCIFRLESRPPRDGEAVVVALEVPLSKIGLPVHLVPQDGLQVEGGCIRAITAHGEKDSTRGLATWTIRGRASEQPYSLLFRLDRRSYAHSLMIGLPHYAPPVDVHSDGVITHVQMEPVRLFGVVPGIDALAFPPWLVAYLLLTIPLAVLAKRLSGTW